jgi:3-phosphoshikimate 1-carboxyvinyltransferase
MIDEFPILFVMAAFADGVTRTSGLEELRVKESDRLAMMARGLAAAGVKVQELADGLVIEGSGGALLAGGARIETRLDHRIAMSFAVAGLGCREPLTVDDARPINTSFPDFLGLMRRLGAELG